MATRTPESSDNKKLPLLNRILSTLPRVLSNLQPQLQSVHVYDRDGTLLNAMPRDTCAHAHAAHNFVQSAENNVDAKKEGLG